MEVVIGAAVVFLIGFAVTWVIARAAAAKCPACRRAVPSKATKCGSCGSDLPATLRPAMDPSLVVLLIILGILVMVGLLATGVVMLDIPPPF